MVIVSVIKKKSDNSISVTDSQHSINKAISCLGNNYVYHISEEPITVAARSNE
jgi:hypothetical protein